MTNTNFTTKITRQRNILNRLCKVYIKTQYTKYDCLACAGNTYSLLRGHAIEGRIDVGFQCFRCPFGGNCTQNIFAKPNFCYSLFCTCGFWDSCDHLYFFAVMPANCCGFSSSSQAVVGLLSFVLH